MRLENLGCLRLCHRLCFMRGMSKSPRFTGCMVYEFQMWYLCGNTIHIWRVFHAHKWSYKTRWRSQILLIYVWVIWHIWMHSYHQHLDKCSPQIDKTRICALWVHQTVPKLNSWLIQISVFGIRLKTPVRHYVHKVILILFSISCRVDFSLYLQVSLRQREWSKTMIWEAGWGNIMWTNSSFCQTECSPDVGIVNYIIHRQWKW